TASSSPANVGSTWKSKVGGARRRSSRSSASAPTRRARLASRRRSRSRRRRSTPKIHAEWQGRAAGAVGTRDRGAVRGAGRSRSLRDAVGREGGRPANYAALGGNPSVRKAQRLTGLILSKPGVEMIAVMSNVVSNPRADLVARGVLKGVIESGRDPAKTIA